MLSDGLPITPQKAIQQREGTLHFNRLCLQHVPMLVNIFFWSVTLSSCKQVTPSCYKTENQDAE